MFRAPLPYAPGILSGNDGSDPPSIMMLVDLQHHDWGQALSFAFADHRHATIGCNRCVAVWPPYQVVKTAGLNLPSFHHMHVCTKPDWCDATVGLQLVSGCPTTGYWIKGGSPRILRSGLGLGLPEVHQLLASCNWTSSR